MAESLYDVYTRLRRTLPALQAYRAARHMGPAPYDRAVTALVVAKDGGEFRAAEALARFLWRGLTATQQANVVRMRSHCLAALGTDVARMPTRQRGA